MTCKYFIDYGPTRYGCYILRKCWDSDIDFKHLTFTKHNKILTILPVKWSKGHFFKKSHFSPVKMVKKCRGRDLNISLMAKN